jgi:hypothetical protein
VGETHGTHETHETYRTHETHECIVPQREPLISQLEAAFADYGAPKAYNDYPVLRPRRPVLRSFSEGGRLGVVGLRLLSRSE